MDNREFDLVIPDTKVRSQEDGGHGLDSDPENDSVSETPVLTSE